jgi:hypothetical protein
MESSGQLHAPVALAAGEQPQMPNGQEEKGGPADMDTSVKGKITLCP